MEGQKFEVGEEVIFTYDHGTTRKANTKAIIIGVSPIDSDGVVFYRIQGDNFGRWSNKFLDKIMNFSMEFNKLERRD